MTVDDPRFRTLVEAVADGTPVDWQAAESTACTDEERAFIQQLRVLAGLAEVHRTGVEPPAPSPDESPRPVPLSPSRAPERWGPLELLDRVGTGSFGTVYRALDPKLARHVAVKLLSFEHAANDRVRAAVIEEARLLARVRHDNVIAVYGADSFDDRVGFWMELLEGKTLKQAVDEQGPLGAREAALIGMDLCRALAAVHAAGLIHRDVKAQNVMRQTGGRIVLMDFGAGVDSAAAAGLVGTPLYIAPELFAGRAATPSSDLYSLGVLLFFLVSREFPVSGTSLDELRQAHAAGDRRRLRDVRPDLPAAFVRVIDRALSSDPSDRPQTAGAFESALAESLEIGPAAVFDGSVPGRASRRWAYALAGSGLMASVLLVAWLAGGFTQPSPIRALAVLPLQNLSGPEHDHLSAGITVELTTNLSKLSDLRVISNTSAVMYRDAHRPLKDIGKELNVDYILEGSVQRDGQRMRLTVQLISARDERHLWAETYERSVQDAFTLQADLARDIARSIDLRITPQEGLRLQVAAPASSEAQEEYLRGWTALERSNSDDAFKAVAHFERAISLDPKYAMAHASLAYAYTIIGAGYSRMSRDEAYMKAKDAALEALELDQSLSAAHYALGVTQFYYEWDWLASEASFRRALELNPNDPNGHQQFGWFLAARGDVDGALDHMQKARVLDPLLYTRRSALAAVLFYSGRYDQAITELTTALEGNPNFHAARFALARSYAAKGMYEEALALFARLPNKSDFRIRAEIARVQAQAGHTDTARGMLAWLEGDAGQNAATAAWDALAFVHAALGDRDRAFEMLDRAFGERAASLVWLKVDPRFDPLRRDPRFTSLLQRIGLPLTPQH